MAYSDYYASFDDIQDTHNFLVTLEDWQVTTKITTLKGEYIG